jgi:hypothetical protein
MEEMEMPTEKLQEEIKERAEEKKKEAKEKWTLNVALSTACIAVLAAISGLLGGHHSNEALISQIKASDQWSFYQAKSIKSEIAASTAKLSATVNHSPAATPEDQQATARYEKDKADIRSNAEKLSKESEEHLTRHVTFAYAVTIFQIAIAISAISILTGKKILWYGSMLLAIAGTVYLILGII